MDDSAREPETTGPSKARKHKTKVGPGPDHRHANSRAAAALKQTLDSDDTGNTNTNINESSKRRCVSTACIACRKRKSKCDGSLPACAACSSVYHTDCEYDPNSDHRRKGVYKKEAGYLKTRDSTLQTLIQAILNYPQDEVADLVQSIRECDSLDKVAELVAARANGVDIGHDEDAAAPEHDSPGSERSAFESQLANKVGELILADGTVRFIGGTSNLLFGSDSVHDTAESSSMEIKTERGNPITSWTKVTSDATLIQHLLNLYFSWHYSFFTILSKELFYADFYCGNPNTTTARRKTEFCTPLLVNAILALACHFSSLRETRADPHDSATAGDHFFKEAKRIIIEDGEFERPSLASVQALSLMSVREAGCARESRGWIYSGMAFRMSCDLGLNLRPAALVSKKDTSPDEKEEDARKITFWGCFLIDKCWSNYLGRLPTFSSSLNTTTPKVEVFPSEDSEYWRPVSDTGISRASSQPARTRAISLQIVRLAEISGDLVSYFYHPHNFESAPSKQTELKRLSEIHTRLEKWKRELPKEMEAKDGQLPSILVMHMFFQLLYIHVFRPFLKYNQTTSPLPSHVSPRKFCTHAALAISKLLRLYKRTHGLQKIVNIAVYIAHSACTIHLLNLPDKVAERDFTHTVKNLEEISESWLCARRTLRVISGQARTWKIDLPEEAATVLANADARFGALQSSSPGSPSSVTQSAPSEATNSISQRPQAQSYDEKSSISESNGGQLQSRYYDANSSLSSGAIYEENAANIKVASPSYGNNNISSDAYADTNSLPLYIPGDGTREHTANNPPSLQGYQTALRLSSSQRTQIGQQGYEATKLSRKRSPTTNVSTKMFGGVEALLRDGQDWWIKDQSQLASGFENWGFFETAQSQQQTDRTAASARSQDQTLSMDWSMGNVSDFQWHGVDSQQHTNH